MTGIRCHGDFCDNISIECANVVKQVGTRTVHADLVGCAWSGWLSEENGGTADFGFKIISGVECSGSNCDNKRFYVCSVSDPAAGVLDPDEARVANSSDFRAATTSFAGANLVTAIHFRANYGGSAFSYYINTDPAPGADVLVSCSASRFRVLRTLPTRPGVFNIPVHEGTPSVSGTRYSVEFPVSALGSLFNRSFGYWFFSTTGGDRMPDVGNGIVVTD